MSKCCNCGEDQSLEFLKVEIIYDENCGDDSPCNWGRFELVKPDRSQIIDGGNPGFVVGNYEGKKYSADELEEAFNEGNAFHIDKYEHGEVNYRLHGEGMQCQWDTSPFNAVLVCTDEDTQKLPEPDKLKFAREFLSIFNKWANGHVYRAVIFESGHVVVSGSGGLYDEEDLLYYLLEEGLPESDVKHIRLCGNALDLFEDELKPSLEKAGYILV